MIHADENALICDFAETYHIYDYKALKPMQAAILASGLNSDSRIKRKMSGQRYELESLLLACIADSLRTLVWFKTKDGQQGVNRPKSILETFTDDSTPEAEYDSIEAYEAARRRILEGN